MQGNRRKGRASAVGSWVMRLVCVLALALSACGIAGCKNNAPKKYAVKNWSEVQQTIDNAKSSDILDLSKLASPTDSCTISIPENFNMAIIGNPDVTYVGVAIRCAGGNAITIQDLNIMSTDNQTESTLQFAGWGNQLILVGNNRITNSFAHDSQGFGAAVGVFESSTLTISGSGSLTAQGGTNAAGIGGGSGRGAGDITIREGVIRAFAGNEGYGAGPVSQAAGIGGGKGGAGGNIVISGGELWAVSYGAAGIGAGSGASEGTLRMSGGKLYACGALLPESGAIYCRIEALPEVYRWWVTTGSAGEIVEYRVFPDNSFNNSATFDQVYIEVPVSQ